jgi:hypothetical protein
MHWDARRSPAGGGDTMTEGLADSADILSSLYLVFT